MVTNCIISTRILFIILDIQFLGYKKGPNGEIAIDEEEAKVVKRIYFDFMIGKSAENIARDSLGTESRRQQAKTNGERHPFLLF